MNSKYTLFLIGFLIFIQIEYIYSQTIIQVFDPYAQCKPYIGDPDDLLLCKNRLLDPNSIYTRNSTSQPRSQEIIKSLLFQVSTAKQCNIEPIRVGVCSLNLPYCNTVSVGPLTFGLPSSICKADCFAMKQLCPLFNDKIDCKNDILFPESSTFFNLTLVGGPPMYQVNCTHPSLVKGSSYNQQICPKPLLVKNQSNEEFSKSQGYNYVGDTDCVTTCPINFFTDDQWDNLYTMSKTLSSIAFCGTLFVWVTYGPLNRSHSFQTISVSLFAFTTWLMTLADIIVAGIGYRELLCPKPGKLAIQSDIACGVTGAIFHIGLMSTILWWSTIGFHLLCKIKRWKPKYLTIKTLLILNTCIGFIMLIIALGRKNIKAGNGVLGCWVVDSVNGYFYIPFAIILGFGSICIVLVTKEIYGIVKSVHNDKRFIKLQIKPIFCILLVFGSFFYVFCTHFYLDTKKEEYLSNMEQYILCISQPFLTEESRSLCKVVGPSYGVLYVFYFLIRFFGIFIFIFYAITPTTKQVWLNSILFRNKYTQKLLLNINIKLDSNYLVSKNTPKNSKQSPNSQNNNESTKSTELEVMDSSKVSTFTE